MRLHLSDVLARAHQRGYTQDEIQPCLGQHLGDGWYDVDTRHPAYPRARENSQPQRVGLGDYVAAGLAAVGITKERVSKAVGGDCGCAKRQEALNAIGRRIGIG